MTEKKLIQFCSVCGKTCDLIVSCGKRHTKLYKITSRLKGLDAKEINVSDILRAERLVTEVKRLSIDPENLEEECPCLGNS